MRIIVCIKRVPSERNVKIDKKTGALIRNSSQLMINKNDKLAIIKAVEIKTKSKEDVEIVALSMSATDDLMLFRECMAMGVDKVVILSDPKFRGSDAWATVNALKAGIEKIGDYDLILTGEVSSDGETMQVGIRLAEKLDIDCITMIDDIEYIDDNFMISKENENRIENYRVDNKLLCTVKDTNFLEKYLSISSIMDAYENDNICIYSLDDLDLKDKDVGLENSLTYVKETYVNTVKSECRHYDLENLIIELKQYSNVDL